MGISTTNDEFYEIEEYSAKYISQNIRKMNKFFACCKLFSDHLNHPNAVNCHWPKIYSYWSIPEHWIYKHVITVMDHFTLGQSNGRLPSISVKFG